jgi:hypothetical protein
MNQLDIISVQFINVELASCIGYTVIHLILEPSRPKRRGPVIMIVFINQTMKFEFFPNFYNLLTKTIQDPVQNQQLGLVFKVKHLFKWRQKLFKQKLLGNLFKFATSCAQKAANNSH